MSEITDEDRQRQRALAHIESGLPYLSAALDGDIVKTSCSASVSELESILIAMLASTATDFVGEFVGGESTLRKALLTMSYLGQRIRLVEEQRLADAGLIPVSQLH